jgi:uncharacterized protein (TIGR02270 family)
MNTPLSSNTAHPVQDVIDEHAETVAMLWKLRDAAVGQPHYSLRYLKRIDQRLAAHFDGLLVAGQNAVGPLQAMVLSEEEGALFAKAVLALWQRRTHEFRALFALAESQPKFERALLAAFAWVERPMLQGLIKSLLGADASFARRVGVAVCALHRVDPGLSAAHALEDSDAVLRARALRASGELGKREFVSALAAAGATDEDPACRFWAGWSAVLLGDRERALSALISTPLVDTPRRAFQLALLASDPVRGHETLQPHTSDPANLRAIIRGTGYIGDPKYVPWLIGHMANDEFARLAGESFSMIAGVDLAWLDLERKPPEDFASGPNDDPEDENVDMDEDDDLPWPDQAKVQAWWNQNGARFTTGVRHFMGAPPSRAHCIDVLKNGYQRQRIAAAYHLCLLNPGTPLFEWRAPAWRQQRELAQMT